MRRSSDIHVGDKVLLSTKHLQLKDKPGKLCPIFVGPFRVLQEIGRNAAKLDLPASMSVHPVFNVSLLRKYYGDRLLPKAVQVEDDAEYEIDSILCHRGRPRHRQYLLRWKGYGPEEDMWVSEAEL